MIADSDDSGSTTQIQQQQQQKRYIAELFARQVHMDPATAMSAAISLGSLANFAKIGSDLIGGFENLFG